MFKKATKKAAVCIPFLIAGCVDLRGRFTGPFERPTNVQGEQVVGDGDIGSGVQIQPEHQDVQLTEGDVVQANLSVGDRGRLEDGVWVRYFDSYQSPQFQGYGMAAYAMMEAKPLASDDTFTQSGYSDMEPWLFAGLGYGNTTVQTDVQQTVDFNGFGVFERQDPFTLSANASAPSFTLGAGWIFGGAIETGFQIAYNAARTSTRFTANDTQWRQKFQDNYGVALRLGWKIGGNASLFGLFGLERARVGIQSIGQPVGFHDPLENFNQSFNVTGKSLGLGLRYHVSDGWSLEAGYTMTNFNDTPTVTQVSPDPLGPVPVRTGVTDLITQRAYLRMRYDL